MDIADPLTELALDLRWNWNYSRDDVWRELDPELWDTTQNAWLLLQTVARERFERIDVRARLKRAGSGRAHRQCQQRHPRSHVGSGRRRCSLGEGCGEERWRGSLEYVEEQIWCLDDREIWGLRSSARKKLVEFSRERLRAQRAYPGAAPQEVGEVFDPGWLTIGFVRRFAEYRRPHIFT